MAAGHYCLPEWDSYINFKNWSKVNGYRPELSIDRKDNDKGYSPSNCRWTTMSKQLRNRQVRDSLSGCIGVRPTKSGKFQAYARYNNRWIGFGSFTDKFSAAWVRDEFVRTHIDKHATMNNLTDRRVRKVKVKLERHGTFVRRKP